VIAGSVNPEIVTAFEKFQRADFRGDLETDGPAGSNGGNEVQTNAIFLE
jgi:hypothetical protein